MKPLQVYLDNADYSNLARHKNDQNISRQYQSLRQFVEQGRIQIRYSGVTLLESAHIKLEDKDYAVERAGVIEILCGGRTLIAPPQLHRQEVENTVRGRRTQRADVYRDSHEWMFDPAEISSGIQNAALDIAYERMGASTRAERRRIKKQAFKKGKLRVPPADQSPQLSRHLSASLHSQYPFLPQTNFESLVSRLLRGELTSEEFGDQMAETVMAPVPFTQHFYDAWRASPSIPDDFLRSQGGKLVNMIEYYRAELSNLFELDEKLGKSKREAKQQVKSIMNEWQDRRGRFLRTIYARDYAQRFGEDEVSIGDILEATTPGDLPSIDLGLQLGWQFAIQRAQDSSASLSASDGTDLFHANYFPYVDVFRADKRMRPLLEQIGASEGLKTFLPKSLDDLITHIENVTA